MSLRILHVLDHSLPLHSGYTFRTRSILRQQRALGWDTAHLTGAKQGATDAAEQSSGGWHFYRTAPIDRWWARLPLLRQPLEPRAALSEPPHDTLRTHYRHRQLPASPPPDQ